MSRNEEIDRYRLIQQLKSWWCDQHGWRYETLAKMHTRQLLAIRTRMVEESKRKSVKKGCFEQPYLIK